MMGANDTWAFTTFTLGSQFFRQLTTGLQVKIDIDTGNRGWLVTLAKSVVTTDGATAPAGETVTPGGEGPGDGTGEPTGGADPATGQPGAGSATDPAVKPVATSPKTTVTKTTKPKSTMATTSALPKTGDSHWIAASLTLFLLGTVFLSAAYRC